ncbi:hypothetical protein J2Y47_003549 [Arcicella sp. BE51]|nr:hypothetical protein [Arcicella sp. BE51]
MQLFLDKTDSVFSGMNTSIQKNDSLYNAFSEAIDLKIDTLKVEGKYELTQSVLAPKFKFYKLSQRDFTRKLNDNELQLFWVFGEKYMVMAINHLTGSSYRILGFNGNDFLNFLSDYLEIYNFTNEKKLNRRSFFRSYHLEGIDLKCLYKGLQADIVERKKYPCLKRASELITIH